MFGIPRRKLLGMTIAVFGFFTTLSRMIAFAFPAGFNRGVGG
jgi:hypothetical protein